MPVSKDEFRRALRTFATGVTVVTSRSGDHIGGMTVSAFCSVSLEPPLVLVCLDRTTETYGLVAASGAFAVNILRQGDDALSQLFASETTDKATALRDLAHLRGATGSPIFQDTLAYLDCRVTRAVPAGDHTVFIGQVEKAGVGGGRPLLFHDGRYRALCEP